MDTISLAALIVVNHLRADRAVPVGARRPTVRADGRSSGSAQTGPGLVRGPGLRFLIPIIDRPEKVDIREKFIEVPSQTTITKDNAPINIDFLIYWYVVDPLRSLVNVQNFSGALQGIATTTLRAVIGDILLDDVLSKRDQINEVLRAKLDEQTERWGGKVTTVEIREIIPPRDVQDAMNRMLSAERNAARRDHRIRGHATGQHQRRRRREAGRHPARRGHAPVADPRGRRLQPGPRAHLLRGTAVDDKTMTLQYLEALKGLGQFAVDEVRHPARVRRAGRPHRQLHAARPRRRSGHGCGAGAGRDQSRYSSATAQGLAVVIRRLVRFVPVMCEEWSFRAGLEWYVRRLVWVTAGQ